MEFVKLLRSLNFSGMFICVCFYDCISFNYYHSWCWIYLYLVDQYWTIELSVDCTYEFTNGITIPYIIWTNIKWDGCSIFDKPYAILFIWFYWHVILQLINLFNHLFTMWNIFSRPILLVGIFFPNIYQLNKSIYSYACGHCIFCMMLLVF